MDRAEKAATRQLWTLAGRMAAATETEERTERAEQEAAAVTTQHTLSLSYEYSLRDLCVHWIHLEPRPGCCW
ncbi:hypothetical protein PR202_gb06930 [Eleusine coracana subsp. coracana]|uniref:Uncharacterized protein n=1 Tax=Eleusine coracana subsp. coracana TaxID=191504 RepID=A0AAV5EAY3_ELECO|nr:hypothetical protein PR202_gb06930 [Eleusine coracana subsp. coracana]